MALAGENASDVYTNSLASAGKPESVLSGDWARADEAAVKTENAASTKVNRVGVMVLG